MKHSINCCKGCKPPKRHRDPVDCHMTCTEYLKQKEAYELDKQKIRELKAAETMADTTLMANRAARKRKRKVR